MIFPIIDVASPTPALSVRSIPSFHTGAQFNVAAAVGPPVPGVFSTLQASSAATAGMNALQLGAHVWGGLTLLSGLFRLARVFDKEAAPGVPGAPGSGGPVVEVGRSVARMGLGGMMM